VPAETGAPGARPHLVRSIAVETALVVAILGVVATWRFTPPPRALAAEAAAPAFTHIHTPQGMANLSIAPGRVGAGSATIEIMNAAGVPLEARDVTIHVSNPALGMEAITRTAERTALGVWRADGLVFPAAGAWDVRLDIRVSDFQQVTLAAPIAIKP
jgi:copper transport protein